MALNGGKQIKTIGIGELQIEQNGVRLRSWKHRFHGRTIRSLHHFVAPSPETLAEKRTEFFLVIHQQNFMFHLAQFQTQVINKKGTIQSPLPERVIQLCLRLAGPEPARESCSRPCREHHDMSIVSPRENFTRATNSRPKNLGPRTQPSESSGG